VRAHLDLGPAGLVEVVWRELVTHTRVYHKFCAALHSDYIHFNPLSKAEPEHSSRYAATLAQYADVYGEAPPPAFWPQHDAPAAPPSSAHVLPPAFSLPPQGTPGALFYGQTPLQAPA
jgi:hypothetical protein